MLLKELIKFSSQHRTLYCYLILSIWIFLLIAGMYKYITLAENATSIINSNHFYTKNTQNDENLKMRKYNQDCNPPNQITREDEGGIIDDWTLQGVLVLTRHGDRGPLVHVRGINSVDCSYEDAFISKYKSFLLNSTISTQGGAGHASWIKPGSFHGFPLLPPSAKTCFLGQLTSRGMAQCLRIGDIIRKAYGIQLGLLNKIIIPNQKPFVNSSNHIDQTYNIDEVVIYSTRYRRTFQSAMAILYTLLPIEKWLSIAVQESHSLSFCFSDCACPYADTLKQIISKESNHILSQHPAVGAVVQWIGSTLLQNPSNQLNPSEVKDAILSLVCHNSPLPCHKLQGIDRSQLTTESPSTTDPDNSDVINIDSDDNVVFGSTQTKEPDESNAETESEGCVEQNHVEALMSYTHWQGLKEMRSKHYRNIGLLKAYGLIRNIVGYMLKMISGDKVKFVLYSGHDRTMEYILAALGLQIDNPFIPYASRLNFEVYKSDKDTQFYFRLLYNGRDITRQIDFCEGGKSLRVSRGNRGNKADLCPIENIIRFIHDDYFSSLNATNYKDACSIVKDSEF